MVHYKLTYFPLRALGETPRELFALANVEFEDERIPKEQWPDHKSSTPFGQMPVLEVDGKKLAQSKAISRYLAKQFGFAGKDDWESAQIDAWVDQFNDYGNEIRPYWPILVGHQEGDKEKLFKELVEPAREKHFSFVVKQLKENKSGFLVGDKISWADLYLSNHIETFLTFQPDYVDKYPEIAAHLKTVHEIPEIKKWIEKRPKTNY